VSPRRELQDQINELFSKSLDEDLTTAEFARLDALIVSNNEALSCLLEFSTFMADLIFLIQNQAPDANSTGHPS
jgi:hypothetical protein